jgi:HEAT repeat protein
MKPWKEISLDKTIKSKEKVLLLAKALCLPEVDLTVFLEFVNTLKDTEKANCIEAIEKITKINPGFANAALLDLIIHTLTEKAPRIKWEAARVLANCAGHLDEKAEKAVQNLIANSNHIGTVVRWSSATALGEILKLKGAINAYLIPEIEFLHVREEKPSIKKIYASALEKAKSSV